MVGRLKKYFAITVAVIFINFITNMFVNNIYALSSNFEFVIDTVGIPRYNVYGEEINEDIYYTYNVFSYSKPKSITKGQRWKNSKYGLWTKEDKSYHGSGTRGEYYILGRSYSGKVIYNYYFPMDEIPITTPENWTFYNYPEALSSWSDTSKYKYEEQLEYMKNSKLMFNDITSRSKADNPKYIREYNITAKSIGLDKARLDTAATWKTYGMISTRRYINGTIFSQVYLVKPMAADANAKVSLSIDSDFVLKEDEDELVIPITYSTQVINLTGFANEKHIKEINAKLLVNNELKEEKSGSKITSVGGEYLLVISRNNYPPNNSYNFEICVNSYVHTEFSVDGLLQDNMVKNIKVYVEPKLEIPVKNTSLMVLEKENQKLVVRPLTQSAISNAFTEAGKHLVAKLNLNIPKERLENISVRIDNKLQEDIEVLNTNSNKVLGLRIKLSGSLSPTIYGEYSLREKEGSFFNIQNNLIGTRKTSPHELKICYSVGNKEYEEIQEFDTLDSVLSNLNTKILLSTNYARNLIDLEKYLNEE